MMEKYKTIQQLGKGSFSTVYEILRLSDNKRFALKVFEQNATVDIVENELFACKKLLELKLPNIVSIEEIIEYDNRKMIVMEKLGEDFLQTVLHAGLQGLSESQAARYVFKILKTLEELHLNGIIHRDIKPENIVFPIGSRSPEDLCIVDFGLSLIWDVPITDPDLVLSDDTVAGSVGYCPPEGLKSKEYSTKSDVWSLGVFVYCILSGTLPFDIHAKDKGLSSILSGRYYPMNTASWKNVSGYPYYLIFLFFFLFSYFLVHF